MHWPAWRWTRDSESNSRGAPAEEVLALAEQAAFVVDGGARRRAVEILQRLDALTRTLIRAGLAAPLTAPLG